MGKFIEWTNNPDPLDYSYTRTFGKRKEARLYYCDNCLRRHWGRVEKIYNEYYFDGEVNFIWTDPKGNLKQGYPC